MKIFPKYFFDMDISLILPVKYLNDFTHVGETHMEGSLSQHFDKGLSFCFIVCRRWDFVNTLNKSQKLPGFCYKTETRT